MISSIRFSTFRIAQYALRNTMNNNNLTRPLIAFNFCSKQPTVAKTYVMPDKDLRSNLFHYYQVNRHIEFKNGRYLLYLNKQNVSTPFLIDLPYTIPLTYIAYLIVNNPFYLTFPAALPIMFMIQISLLLLWAQRKSVHKRQIQRIYLYSPTDIQIVYSNKIRRYMKNNEKSQIMFIDEFEPKYDKQVLQGRVKQYPSTRFPADPTKSLAEVNKPNAYQYGWAFRDKSFNNYILPAKFQYADWQILTRVLNGTVINFTSVSNQGQQFKPQTYPTIQQEYKNIQQLRKKLPQQVRKSSKNTQNISPPPAANPQK